MDALSIDDKADANTCAHRHIAERFFYVWIVRIFGLDVLKHGRHVHIRIKEDSIAALISVETKPFTEGAEDREVLPCNFRSRRNITVFG